MLISTWLERKKIETSRNTPLCDEENRMTCLNITFPSFQSPQQHQVRELETHLWQNLKSYLLFSSSQRHEAHHMMRLLDIGKHYKQHFRWKTERKFCPTRHGQMSLQFQLIPIHSLILTSHRRTQSQIVSSVHISNLSCILTSKPRFRLVRSSYEKILSN